MSTCQYNYATSMEFPTDNIKHVTILQTTVGSASPVCGKPSFMYYHNNKNSTWSDVMTYEWTKVNANTHNKAVQTYFQFENFPQFIMTDGGIWSSWTQGCEIQLNKVEFDAYTLSAYITETNTTTAQANMYINATATGNCGSDYTMVANLINENTGVSTAVPFTTAEVLAVAG